MFRHRKRLISKRLTRLMHQKTKKSMKAILSNFIQSRASQLPNPLSISHQPQSPAEDSESIESQSIDVSQEQANPSNQFSIVDYVATLSPHDQKMFKQENPDLPETFFMTKKQKIKYFALKAQNFQTLLKKTPDRKSSNKNHVQFKEKFAFKPFNEFQKVSEVKKAKESQSPYSSQIHFS